MREAGSDKPYTLGLDLGGSSIKAVAVAPERELRRANVAFDAAVKFDWLEKARALAADFEKQLGPATHLGISAPGLAASDGRSIRFMPGRLEGLEGLIWQDALERSEPVPVLNDAHAAILGERWHGAAQGHNDVFMLTLGTGVGGAAIVDGNLLLGAIGRGGHLGHASLDVDGPPDVTGMPGSLEVAIGNCTIEQRSGGRFTTTHQLIAAYEAGDAFAATVWLRSVKALACAIASFINILDPSIVIIGGGIARARASLFEPLENFLREVEWQPGGHQVPVVPAQLGEYAGAYGAAFKASQQKLDGSHWLRK